LEGEHQGINSVKLGQIQKTVKEKKTGKKHLTEKTMLILVTFPMHEYI